MIPVVLVLSSRNRTTTMVGLGIARYPQGVSLSHVNKVSMPQSWWLHICDRMEAIRKGVLHICCFMGALGAAVWPAGAEGWVSRRSRLALVLGLYQVDDSGNPGFPSREDELTMLDTAHLIADPCRPTVMFHQELTQ